MSKTPKLRFKEFSGDWEYKKLEDISTQIKRTSDYVIDNILTISAGRGFLEQKDRFSQVIAGNSLSKYTLLYENEFSYNRGNSKKYTYGCIYRLRNYKEALVPNVYISFKLENQIEGFYEQLFIKKYLDRQLRQLISSSARMDGLLNINKSDFFKVKIPVPKLEEQEKIASFFSLIDDKISLQGEKVEALKDYKKGMMQKIFSRELRFKDDEGRDYPEWEEKKLGQISDIYQPQTISQQDFTISGYKVYGANGIIGFYSKYNHETEQIAITCRGNTCGTVNITERKSWITGNAMVVNVDEYLENVNKYFLGFLLDYSNLKYMITGSGQPQITRDVVSSHKIKLPCLSEQNKISRLLLKIDMKLNKEQEKLDSLNQYKKGLLQQMFV